MWMEKRIFIYALSIYYTQVSNVRNLTVEIYRVIKTITVNSQAVCQIGDILMVDESAYDGASVMNLTQGWGFCPMSQYENVVQVDRKDYSWNEYMSLYHGNKEVQTAFINQYKEIIPDKKELNVIVEKLRAKSLLYQVKNQVINEPVQVCQPDKDGLFNCKNCLKDCSLSNDTD
jgi:hypothetical protein